MYLNDPVYEETGARITFRLPDGEITVSNRGDHLDVNSTTSTLIVVPHVTNAVYLRVPERSHRD